MQNDYFFAGNQYRDSIASNYYKLKVHKTPYLYYEKTVTQ